MNNDEMIEMIATLEMRVKLSVNLNMFDRSLIVADLTGMPKEQALDKLLDIRKVMIR